MKISRLVLGFTAVTVIAFASLGVKASAASTTCTVEGAPLGKWGSYFTVNGSNITADFTVKGQDCGITMSLVTWKAPAADAQPLYEQKLYSYKTQVFGPGKHQMVVNLPDCYYQADLMVGTKADWAEADNTPKKIQFPERAGDPWPDMGLRDFKIGGDKKCVEPPKTPQVKPTSTTTPTPTPAPTKLADTGPGTVIGIGAAVTIVGAMVHQFVQRKLYR